MPWGKVIVAGNGCVYISSVSHELTRQPSVCLLCWLTSQISKTRTLVTNIENLPTDKKQYGWVKAYFSKVILRNVYSHDTIVFEPILNT